MHALLGSFIGDPYDWGGRYMAVYLAFPIITTTVLAVRWRRLDKTTIVALASVASALAFAFLYSLAWGVHSTIGIGLVFALGVYTPVSVVTVVLVRTVLSRVKATSPPAASS